MAFEDVAPDVDMTSKYWNPKHMQLGNGQLGKQSHLP